MDLIETLRFCPDHDVVAYQLSIINLRNFIFEALKLDIVRLFKSIWVIIS